MLALITQRNTRKFRSSVCGRSLEEMSLSRQFNVDCCREQIIAMATFYSLMSFVSVNGFEYSDPGSFDLIANLPLEIAIIILR